MLLHISWASKFTLPTFRLVIRPLKPLTYWKEWMLSFQRSSVKMSVERDRGCPSLQLRLDGRAHGGVAFPGAALESARCGSFPPGHSGAWCALPASLVPVRFCPRSRWTAATNLFWVWRPAQLQVAWEWLPNSKEQPQLEVRSLPVSSLIGWLQWLVAASGLDLTLPLTPVAAEPLKGPWRTELCRCNLTTLCLSFMHSGVLAGLLRATLSQACYAVLAWVPSQVQPSSQPPLLPHLGTIILSISSEVKHSVSQRKKQVKSHPTDLRSHRYPLVF